METKELILPEGWEVKEVRGNKIILKEKEELPKTWEKCCNVLEYGEYIDSALSVVKNFRITIPNETDKSVLPSGLGGSVLALCQLLICRNAWWKALNWKPDWKNCSTVKHCIQPFSEKIDKSTNRTGSVVLAFPTIEIRDQFLETFRDLIEEAKELL